MKVTDPPSDLVTLEEKQYYRKFVQELIDSGHVLKLADRYGLAVLVRNTVLARKAMIHIGEHGAAMNVKGDKNSNIVKKNPNLDVLKDAQTNIRFYQREFGLTTASRPNIITPPKDGDGEGDGFNDV